ncbi:ice-binding family protein [Pedobacter arcticus]|uniref:ice-binding family protein n=1 Tax=Pedobacter arcticus TaxID=752140 RepID=UPI0002D782F9|nr:ice-binding family protein [Pedobacter arcticus]
MNNKLSSSGNSTAAFIGRGYLKLNAFLFLTFIGLALVLNSCKKDDYTGEVSGVCPTVTSDPLNAAVDVAVNKVIGLTFNTPMKGATINSANISLKQGTAVVTGTLSPTGDSKTYTFTPTTPLQPSTTYTGTVKKDVQDTLRSFMVEDYVWSFKTMPRITLSVNPLAPAVSGIVTGAGDFNQGSNVTVNAVANPGFAFTNWSKAGLSVSTDANYLFKMDGNVDLVANFAPLASVRTVIITPYLNGSPSVLGGTTTGSGSYTNGSAVTIRAFANSTYSFTGFTQDIITTVNPYTFAISANVNIRANFASGGPVIGTAVGPLLPSLGGAANYSVLTKSGISTTGVTLITGNIGVSPAAATAITGFGLIMDASGEFSRTPLVVGNVYASNYAAPTPSNLTTAISNMETAYTTANNLVTPAPVVGLGAGNISGLNLAPGLYKWSTGVLIDPNTTVTLTGGANDTWVLQIAGDLTVSNNAKVQLAGGAQAKNIIWVVAIKAMLGTQANFNGNILSKELISLNNGAVVNGRLLAQTAVTLIGSTVIQP